MPMRPNHTTTAAATAWCAAAALALAILTSDLELVGAALPFGLKLTSSALVRCVLAPAGSTCAIERSHPGFGEAVLTHPDVAVGTISSTHRRRDVPLLYWTAASLGLAISVSPNDAALLARLPEVRALLGRALELDESWGAGALHEFEVTLAGSVPGVLDVASITRHFDRAVELSRGRSADAYLAYAEAVSIPQQNAAGFRALLAQALAVDADADPQNRLVNLLAHRRARWVASRADELILEADAPELEGK
jgi:hypothetical protein